MHKNNFPNKWVRRREKGGLFELVTHNLSYAGTEITLFFHLRNAIETKFKQALVTSVAEENNVFSRFE